MHAMLVFFAKLMFAMHGTREILANHVHNIVNMELYRKNHHAQVRAICIYAASVTPV